MYSASDLRKGLKIEIDGDPYEITDYQFVKPGKGQALYRCKIKNLNSGGTIEKTFRAADKIGKPNLEEKKMIFSFVEGTHFVFMDPDSYDQVHVDADVVGSQKYFLIEDMECSMLFFNDRPIELSLPNFIEKQVIETEPGVRGDTATNVSKPAKLDNGYELAVPIFVNQGDWIRIDTRDGKYSERVR